MQIKKHPLFTTSCSMTALLAVCLVAGCKSAPELPVARTEPAVTAPTAPEPAPAPVAAPVAPAPAKQVVPVRIKAGPSEPFKDADGNAWIPEVGFADGETVERPDIQIANTATPAIYQSEHYSMTSFSYPVPNGKYIVKLHFAETYEGITGPGERVFSFNVEGHQFDNFDVWVKAGGPLRAYVETVDVEVKDGKLDITFTPNVENPEINGIEILPAP